MNQTEITGKITIQQTKSLFWPIVWSICFFPIGIPWLTWRLHENSKATGNTIPRNVMLTLIGVFLLLFLIGVIFGPKGKDKIESVQKPSQSNELLTKLAQ